MPQWSITNLQANWSPNFAPGENVFQDVCIVFLGFKPPSEGKEAHFFADMEHIAGALPRVIYVHNAGGVELES